MAVVEQAEELLDEFDVVGVLLICHAGEATGLGHLSRVLAVEAELERTCAVGPNVVVLGDDVQAKAGRAGQRESLTVVPPDEDVVKSIVGLIDDHSPHVVVLDLHPNHIPDTLPILLSELERRGIPAVGIDSLFEHREALALLWVPCFYLDPSQLDGESSKVEYGWDSYLLRKRLQSRPWSPGGRVLVVTGGGDPTGQAATLPALLDDSLPAESEVDWVQGPLASPPALPLRPRLGWTVHNAPESLDELIVGANYALVVYGVSFFEILQYGVPSVVFSPYDFTDPREMEALKGEDVASLSDDAPTAVRELVRLMSDHGTAGRYSTRAVELLEPDGAARLARRIVGLARS